MPALLLMLPRFLKATPWALLALAVAFGAVETARFRTASKAAATAAQSALEWKEAAERRKEATDRLIQAATELDGSRAAAEARSAQLQKALNNVQHTSACATALRPVLDRLRADDAQGAGGGHGAVPR